jgi:deazaflavin-dependent oxidoreductase (nitroreductase family)
MARKYQVTGVVRFFNRIGAFMIRRNMGPQQNYLLTVRGRKTGNSYSIPVSLIEQEGKRWLVSPYGQVNWVKNARAVGEVMLSRGGKTETLKIRELDSKPSAPILKEYVKMVSFVDTVARLPTHRC